MLPDSKTGPRAVRLNAPALELLLRTCWASVSMSAKCQKRTCGPSATNKLLSLSFPRPFVLDVDGNRAVGVGFRIVVGAELIAVDRILGRPLPSYSVKNQQALNAFVRKTLSTVCTLNTTMI